MVKTFLRVVCFLHMVYSINVFSASIHHDTPVYVKNNKLVIDNNEIKNVVVDLNGVMFESNKFKAMKKLGIASILRYVFSNGLPNTDYLFHLLQKIPAKNKGQQIFHQGALLPPILVDWQLGLSSSDDLLKKIHPLIDAQDLTAIQKKIFHRLISFMLTPKDLIESFDPIFRGHRLIKSLRLYQRHLRIFALSNWDKESFPLLVDSFPDFFNLLDGHVVSGNVGKVKPGSEIFQHLMSDFNLDPKETLFIDDEPENLLMARSLGFQTLEISDLADLIEQLKQHDLWLECL